MNKKELENQLVNEYEHIKQNEIDQQESVKYINADVKQTYIDYSIDILVKLQTIKNHMKEIHKDASVINHGHIGDLARIDCDLIDIINYL